MSDLSDIVIATPVDGDPHTASVSAAYHASICALHNSGAVSLSHKMFFSDDLVRARSRAVRRALGVPGWKWLLWIDEDIAFDPAIVPLMRDLATEDGHDIIAAPYRRKRIDEVYPYKPLDEQIEVGQLKVVRNCVEVDFIAIGFCFTSRSCLELMVEHYRDAEWFTEQDPDGEYRETVGIFKQVHSPVSTLPDGRRLRDLFSEDYSFMSRWRQIGGKIQMYIGPGSPVTHLGTTAFIGKAENIIRYRG